MGILFCLVLLALATAMLRAGWKSRRLDDHPTCGKCGFDLFGRPADSICCPECGAELTDPNSIRIRHRKHRADFLLGAALLGTLGVAGICLVAWISISGVNLEQYKPVWLLLSETDDPRGRALDELVKRLQSGRLSNQQILSIANKALAVQAAPKLRWSTDWLLFVSAARSNGLLSEAQWQQCWSAAWNARLVVRQRVSRKHPAITVSAGAIPTGGAPLFSSRVVLFAWSYRITKLQIAGVSCDASRFSQSEGFDQGGGKGGGSGPIVVELPANSVRLLADGSQTATAEIEITVDNPASPQTPLANATVPVSTSWQLVSASDPTVSLLQDPKLDARMKQAFTLTKVWFDPGYKGVVVEFNVNQPPVNLHSQLVIRANDKEWTKDYVVVGTPNGRGSGTVVIPAPDFTGEVADVILRPDAEAAAETLNVTTIWGGEIVFPNVPIGRAR